MDERRNPFPFYVGIAFVILVVAYAWFSREDEGKTQREVAKVTAPHQYEPPQPGVAPSAEAPVLQKVAEDGGAKEQGVHSASPAPPPKTETTSGAATPMNLPGPAAQVVRMAPREAQRASMDKEDIRKVISDLKPQFTQCYQQGRANDPKVGEGRVTVEFTLKRDVTMGSIPDEGAIAESTLNAPIVEACILEKLRGAKFPEMKGEGSVKVRYPFVFNVADGG